MTYKYTHKDAIYHKNGQINTSSKIYEYNTNRPHYLLKKLYNWEHHKELTEECEYVKFMYYKNIPYI